MRKARAPDLTEERIEKICELIDEWTGPITWKAVIEAVERALGAEYSRFTLLEHSRITSAFNLQKTTNLDKPHDTSKPRVPRDELVREALARVEKYKKRAIRLEMENKLLLEQFMTWAVNAERKGVTIDMLNAPLPKPDRQRSERVK